MARLFIGQNGFYPSWARTQGRWVLQRVFTTVRGLFQQTDEMNRPTISFESLLWVAPKPNFKNLFFRSVNEGSLALYELKFIPLICSNQCEKRCTHPEIEVNNSLGPEGWRLRCPKCGTHLFPDLQPLRPELIMKQWLLVGRPILDHPSAATSIKSIKPIIDLEKWIQQYQPMDIELAYVGQQLWPTFAEFIQSYHPDYASSNVEGTEPTN